MAKIKRRHNKTRRKVTIDFKIKPKTENDIREALELLERSGAQYDELRVEIDFR